jgi:hypothetical protein
MDINRSRLYVRLSAALGSKGRESLSGNQLRIWFLGRRETAFRNLTGGARPTLPHFPRTAASGMASRMRHFAICAGGATIAIEDFRSLVREIDAAKKRVTE